MRRDAADVVKVLTRVLFLTRYTVTRRSQSAGFRDRLCFNNCYVAEIRKSFILPTESELIRRFPAPLGFVYRGVFDATVTDPDGTLSMAEADRSFLRPLKEFFL